MSVFVARLKDWQQELVGQLQQAFSMNYPEVVLNSRMWWRLALKRMFDFGIALILVVAVAPVMLLIALAIKLDSKGPVFFFQERVGRSGRPFQIYKFRTMEADAESKTGPVWAVGKNDPRITRVGRFLRRAHLDELPQLLNVVKSDMSLVGPRPERPCFVEQLEGKVQQYNQRLLVKPGMTGLAQVHYRYDQTIADVKKKVRFDLLYIQRMCLMLDMRILAWTSLVVLTGRAVK